MCPGLVVKEGGVAYIVGHLKQYDMVSTEKRRLKTKLRMCIDFPISKMAFNVNALNCIYPF